MVDSIVQLFDIMYIDIDTGRINFILRLIFKKDYNEELV